MPDKIVVWAIPQGCLNCVKTMKWLEEHELEFEVEDITAPEHERQLSAFKNDGLMQAPIVEALVWEEPNAEGEVVMGRTDIWSGHNVMKLMELLP